MVIVRTIETPPAPNTNGASAAPDVDVHPGVMDASKEPRHAVVQRHREGKVIRFTPNVRNKLRQRPGRVLDVTGDGSVCTQSRGWIMRQFAATVAAARMLQAEFPRLTPHDARRVFITSMEAAGQSLATIRDLVGHRSIAWRAK